MAKKGSSKKRKTARAAWCVLILLAAVLILPVVQVACVSQMNPPTTGPILLRQVVDLFSPSRRTPIRYEWKNLRDVPLIFIKHVWISEDQRFFQHNGFDFHEIDLAMKKAERTGKPVRGSSTISMQCARSLFLWQGRSWLRKGLEAYYTLLMEWLLPKKRIMELYVNVIEMGDHVYGIEAGAKYHFGVPARALTREQSALLAALLPNPRGWNPKAPPPVLVHRQQHILEEERNVKFPAQLLR